MPWTWKAMMFILVVCLLASTVIATYKLSTTPQELFAPTSDAWNTLRWPE